MCVCVCKREREEEREWLCNLDHTTSIEFFLLCTLFIFLFFLFLSSVCRFISISLFHLLYAKSGAPLIHIFSFSLQLTNMLEMRYKGYGQTPYSFPCCTHSLTQPLFPLPLPGSGAHTHGCFVACIWLILRKSLRQPASQPAVDCLQRTHTFATQSLWEGRDEDNCCCCCILNSFSAKE